MQKLKYFLYNFMFFVLSLALLYGEINEVVSPYILALCFALIRNEVNLLNYLFGTTLAAIFYGATKHQLIYLMILAIIIALVYLAYQKKKIIKNSWIIIVGILLSGVFQILLSDKTPIILCLNIVNIVLELCLYYVYSQFIRGIIHRGFNAKLAVDEFLGLALFILPIVFFLMQIDVFNINLGRVFFAAVIMLTSVVVGVKECITVAVILGLSATIYTGNIGNLGIMCVWALSASCLKNFPRFLVSVVVFIVDVLIGSSIISYEVYSIYNLVETLLACTIVSIILPKHIQRLKACFYADKQMLSTMEIINQEERFLVNKTNRLGELLYRIHDVYRNMIVGGLDEKEVIQSVKRSVINNNCIKCIKRKMCYEKSLFAEKALENLVEKAVVKNKVGIIDIPDFLIKNCGKANFIMNEINYNIEKIEKYKNEIQTEDNSKLVVSNQLLGISDILKRFAVNSAFGCKASAEKEQAFIDAMLYYDILIKECAIFELEDMFNRAIIVVKNNQYKKTEFLKALKAYFKVNVEIVGNLYAQTPGYKIITIVKASKYTYEFGAARESLKLKSGDLYSKLDLDGSKVMVSLSDGKGAGVKANQISEITLSLLESFYKVGYESNVILDNINQVMSFKSGENFAAIDVCVINLENGSIDFIKRGGTPSVIKSINSVMVVESDSLPIGVVDDSKSNLKRGYLSAGDIVVLASDGVFDAFGSINNFAGYINNLFEQNMDNFAQNILDQAIRLYGGKAKDDMTVVCFKLLLNNR